MSKELVKVTPKEIETVDSVREKYELLESDLNVIQHNLTSTAEQVNSKIPELLELVSAAQHPKMYEALAKVVGSIAVLNREAAAIVKQKQSLYDGNKPQEVKNVYEDKRTINNNFAGSPLDMLNELEEEGK